jgi:anti-anti-sigma factor
MTALTSADADLCRRTTSRAQTATPGLQRVLVVDDDLTSREFLRGALDKDGWSVVTVDGVSSAQQELLASGFDVFDCVVTDYQMPEMTGLDLLAWLQEWNWCLATIILTSRGEKELVAESLRGGAADFLEKPVDLQKLRAAILQASAQTHQRRHASEVQLSVRELGQTQERLLQAHASDLPVRMNICFHPKLEAGGDFFSHFQPAPEQYCCLLTDVSGHDLQAAYLSAYFQGIVRGMLGRAAPLPEVFNYFNRLLLEEWKGLTQSETGTSVAVCALVVDFHRQTVNVITCGSPAPVYVAPDGRAQRLTEPGGAPLGWFDDLSAPAQTHATEPGGTFLLWTDGLEDLAEQNQVSALSMGYRLQRARLHHRPPKEVAAAADDILFAEVCLPDGHPEPAHWHPLVFEEYHGGQAGEIDQLQDHWFNSVRRAAPELAGRVLHDLLLAAREAVLNALRHGCQGDANRRAVFQIGLNPASHTLRIWVDDPGQGHDFDLTAHEKDSQAGVADLHRGLILMKHLSRRLTIGRHGASVIMDFEIESQPGTAAAPTEPSLRAALPALPAQPSVFMNSTISLESQNNLLSIKIPGDLTSTNVRDLALEIEPALALPPGQAAPWKTVALHLPNAKMVDSMGLNFIVKIYKAAHQAGARMLVVCPNPNIHRTLTFTRLDQQVELVKT